MEAMLSEFDYFTPTVTESTITLQYVDEIGTSNPMNSEIGNPLCELEFKIPATADLYRDLANTVLMLKCKLTLADGSRIPDDIPVAPTNLFAHSLWANISLNLNGKELQEKDWLYAHRAMLTTLLSYDKDVQETRCWLEAFSKDEAGRMDETTIGAWANSGFMTRKGLAEGSRIFTMYMRPHLDLFEQSLCIPPNCQMTIKFTPQTTDFALMAHYDDNRPLIDGLKICLMDAQLLVMTKRITPELVLAQKEMLGETNLRFPLNRVIMQRYGIARGFTSVGIPLLFTGKLPKRIFITFAENTAVTGVRDKNPFNFQNFGMKAVVLYINGMQQGYKDLNYTNGDFQSAYVGLMRAIGIDVADKSVNITTDDYAGGYAIYGFLIAPGPIDATVQSVANSTGTITVRVTADKPLTTNIDMIVYAELSGVMELDKVGVPTIM